MRQERTVQATIFEVFAGHQIGCELKAISGWLDGQGPLISLVASDFRREGLRQTGRRGLPGVRVPMPHTAKSLKRGNCRTTSPDQRTGQPVVNSRSHDSVSRKRLRFSL